MAEVEADEYTRLVIAGHPRAQAAEALMQWMETTHGNEFGHDHHCPLPSYPKDGPWVAPAGDPEVCTCGWSAFMVAHARLLNHE